MHRQEIFQEVRWVEEGIGAVGFSFRSHIVLQGEGILISA